MIGWLRCATCRKLLEPIEGRATCPRCGTVTIAKEGSSDEPAGDAA